MWRGRRSSLKGEKREERSVYRERLERCLWRGREGGREGMAVGREEGRECLWGGRKEGIVCAEGKVRSYVEGHLHNLLPSL